MQLQPVNENAPTVLPNDQGAHTNSLFAEYAAPRAGVNAHNLPEQLKQLNRWLAWRLVPDGERLKKIPINVNSGGFASVDSPTTWSTFADAQAYVATNEGTGIGFPFGKDVGVVVVDFDKTRASSDDDWPEWMLDEVSRLDSFTEVSASGRGMHVLCLGSIPSNLNKQGVHTELWDSNKMFCLTGDVFEGRSVMQPRDLSGLHKRVEAGEIGPTYQKPITATAYNSERYTDIINCNYERHGLGRSEAVQSALWTLARKTNCDADAMRAEFEATALRESWGVKWDRLADREIKRAVEQVRKLGAVNAAKPVSMVLKPLSSIQTVPIQWLWKGYLAAGKLTTINGEPGHGKSLVSLDLAARVTTGKDWPDGNKNTLAPSKVLVITVEEDAGDTIKPRSEVAGGNADNLSVIEMNGGDGIFQVERDVEALAEQLKGGQYKLVILDPTIDFTRAQQNVDGEVRPVLNKLGALAGDCGLSVCCINHLNKKSDLAAIHRVAGARAWTSVARLNFLVGRGEDTEVRHLVALKNNIAKEGGSLDFNIEEVTHGLVAGGYPRAKWIGKGNTTADEMMAQKPKSTTEVESWLRSYMPSNVAVPSAKIEAVSPYSKAQLRAAAAKLGVKFEYTKTMPATRVWRLPGEGLDLETPGSNLPN